MTFSLPMFDIDDRQANEKEMASPPKSSPEQMGQLEPNMATIPELLDTVGSRDSVPPNRVSPVISRKVLTASISEAIETEE